MVHRDWLYYYFFTARGCVIQTMTETLMFIFGNSESCPGFRHQRLVTLDDVFGHN